MNEIRRLVILLILTICLLSVKQLYYNNYNYNALTNKVVNNIKKAVWYRKETQLRKNLKYILLWSPSHYVPHKVLGEGQKAFIANNCTQIKCYVTDNKRFFGDNLKEFDVIAFNHELNNNVPTVRAPHQKYIYFSMESAANNPVSSKAYDGFFNWTVTYKLDSDIVFSYFKIKNARGEVVGPKVDMEWVTNMDDIDDQLKTKLKSKRLAAAWFVSNCKSKSDRMEFVHNLQNKLTKYSLHVDIFGQCGKLKCPHDQHKHCNMILKKDYYFYMSLENSFSEDYVTEKVLTALNNDVVPIVYGGANYTRFLPPGSYIDARSMSVEQLAQLMDYLMKHPELYQRYFRWKKYYTYTDDESHEVCSICQILYENRFTQYSSYDKFLEWWNPKTRY